MTATDQAMTVDRSRVPHAPLANPAVDAFLLHVIDVARTVAPALIDIIGTPAPGSERASWAGDRKRGLALCASMLSYARAELATGDDRFRIDLAIGYVTAELAAIEAASAQPH